MFQSKSKSGWTIVPLEAIDPQLIDNWLYLLKFILPN